MPENKQSRFYQVTSSVTTYGLSRRDLLLWIVGELEAAGVPLTSRSQLTVRLPDDQLFDLRTDPVASKRPTLYVEVSEPPL